MTNTPATFKQADLERAIRAAKKVGMKVRVLVTKDGAMLIEDHGTVEVTPEKPVAARGNIKL